MAVHVDDRRVFDRFMARFPVKYRHSRSNYGRDVFLRDVSAQGAKIVTKDEIHVDDTLELAVELPDGHDPMILKGTITWVRNPNPSTWNAGVEFDKVNFMKTQRIFQFCS